MELSAVVKNGLVAVVATALFSAPAVADHFATKESMQRSVDSLVSAESRTGNTLMFAGLYGSGFNNGKHSQLKFHQGDPSAVYTVDYFDADGDLFVSPGDVVTLSCEQRDGIKASAKREVEEYLPLENPAWIKRDMGDLHFTVIYPPNW